MIELEFQPRLKPCPFHETPSQVRLMNDKFHPKSKGLFYVLCGGCGSSAGRSLDVVKAVELWNFRRKQ